MIVGVIRFPGSNCDDDALHAVDRVMAPSGMTGRMIWHKDSQLGAIDALIVPGGFSYGDYLRSGAMAAHSPIMAAVKRFAEAGGPVLGICNGFQILCEAGLLEGGLTRNQHLLFICRDIYCTVEGRATPFTRAARTERPLRLSIAHAEGRYVHPEPDDLAARGQVIFRYAGADGACGEADNPNGSVANIAGVCNRAGNVVGLMPHPERAVEDLLGRGGEDGRALFESLLAHHRAHHGTETGPAQSGSPS
ncbi:MAG: phosphoribosylformylglycinamidine synthase subunit PurQ [Myxococcota bacterium]